MTNKGYPKIKTRKLHFEMYVKGVETGSDKTWKVRGEGRDPMEGRRKQVPIPLSSVKTFENT